MYTVATKTTPKLVLEIIITLAVAFLISAVLALILSFIIGNGGSSDNAMVYVNNNFTMNATSQMWNTLWPSILRLNDKLQEPGIESD